MMGPPLMPGTLRLALALTATAMLWRSVDAQNTAALIIGGFSDDEPQIENTPQSTASVELFGCPGRGQDSFLVEDYPFRVYYSGGIFSDDQAISCGGVECEAEVCDGVTDACFSWRPRDAGEDQWQPHSSLFEMNWNFVIAEVYDLDEDPPSGERTLMTVGPSRGTQIYNASDGNWRNYRQIEDNSVFWSADRCVVQVGEDVYHVDETVHKLNTLTWTVDNLGPVPVPLADPGRCSVIEIYGRPGILLRSGFWYDIEQFRWEERAFPPDSNFLVEAPDSAFSYQGKMTIFGNPKCDSEGACAFKDVVQYDESLDAWKTIGEMQMQRTRLDVIEVPAEWCDDILGPTTDPTTTPSSTGDATDPPIPGEGTDNVAMIVGGVWEQSTGGQVLPSVELFGCPGYQGESLPIQDYPHSIYITAGVYLEDDDKVVVCSGMQCDNRNATGCQLTTDCFEYTPQTGWQSFASLQTERQSFLMADIVNINSGSDQRYPAAIGDKITTEIYNDLTNAWEPYQDLPEVNWRTLDCLVQYEDYIFHLRSTLTRLDTTTWESVNFDVPNFLQVSASCAVVRVNGYAGIMLKNGYWFNLFSETWESLQFPPYPTFVSEPDALFGYRGQPTIFGNPSCNSEGECQYLDVVTYDSQDDVWYNIGEMIHPRRYHTVIEVPSSFCDQTEPPEPSTTTAAILIGGIRDIDFGPDGLPGGEDGTGEALTTVEIFGCPQSYERSIRLEDFPIAIYGATGIYYPNEEHVLVCGGAPCDDGDLACDFVTDCYQWTPEDGWQDAQEGDANAPRWSGKMFLSPDHNSGSSARTPLILGGFGPLQWQIGDASFPTNMVPEIFDPDSGFQIYDPLPVFGFDARHCLTSYGDDVYAIVSSLSIYVLHLPTWTIEVLGEVPTDFVQQRCSPVEIDGQLGLMLRNGYWFNFATSAWEAKQFPPNNVYVDETNSMFYFQGRPTIFGSPQCDSEGNCFYTEVLQYNSPFDRWEGQGSILESRTNFEMVEVPRSICDRIEAAGAGITTTEATSQGTTPEPITDPYIRPDTSTVAMIIGGVWLEATRRSTMSSVELFGCPGYEDRSFPLQDVPRGVYGSGGTYFPNNQDVGKVVLCGGFMCNDGVIEPSACGLTDTCYEWNLPDGDWTEAPSLLNAKFSHLMALVKNLDNVIVIDGEDVVVEERVPAIIGGYNVDTEIYNVTTREWTEYRDLPAITEDWLQANCLIPIEDKIYHIGIRFYELDTLTWQITRDLDVPGFLQYPGRCSQARVRDVEGILLTNGYWFNLQTEVWEQIRLPPFPEFLDYDVEGLLMISFRGKPTVFNMPSCDENAECIYNSVVQYDGNFNRWDTIGTILHHRGLSTIIEVPSDYCEVARYETPSTRTAAIVLGGIRDREQPNSGDNLLQSAELFGCPGSISIPMEDFPVPIYLTGGVHFVLDEENDPYGKVVVCGGFSLSLVSACWELDPATMTWDEADYSLNGVRWAHEMVLAPDLDSGSNERVPMVLGGQNRESEIWDPVTDSWKLYRSLPLETGDFWTSIECTVIYQDVMYHIRNNIYALDLFSWEVMDYGEVPSVARNPGRCEVVPIDGSPGIMLKNGYWYNLVNMSWESKRFPPNPPDSLADEADSFFKFRGSVAIFGAPMCDENQMCEYKEVLWYDPIEDTYVSIGNMREGRHNHEVIEVPDSFCELIPNVSPTTDAPYTGSTVELPSPAVIDTESVAMVIGGFWNHPHGPQTSSSVELFGCEDSVDPVTGEYIGKLIDDFPISIYLSGGTYYEEENVDAEGEGRAVVCGGYYCTEGTLSCQITGQCFAWTPDDQWQPFENDLNNAKWSHIMVKAKNLDDGSEEKVPLVLGQSLSTEIFNTDTRSWEPYRELEDNGWNAISCLVSYGDKVYQIGGGLNIEIHELDLTTWETKVIGIKPDSVRSPGTCAMATIDGIPGVMVSTGFWLNLQDYTWEQKQFPPYFDGFLTPNAMDNFRGKATVFGSHLCTEDGVCDALSVYSYEDASDEWKYLGRLIHTRSFHEIIEVPKSFCNVQTYEPPRQDTAALIIGGLGGFTDTGRREIYNSVELFGCSGQERSILVDEFPKALYLTAGRYFDSVDRDEGETEGTVLVCGGFACDDVVNTQGCRITEECFEWTMQDGWSQRPEQMERPRWAHLLAGVTDLDSGANAQVPLVLGLTEDTAIFDYREGQWDSYLSLGFENWNTLGCLLQYQDTVYHLRTEIYALNTNTWEVRMLDVVPEILASAPGKCAISEINGETGILLRNGFWYNLETETWEAKRFPPYINFAGQPDALFSFRGRPTMFGGPVCDGEGNCEYTEVLQYNEMSDTWNSLGNMLFNRQLHEVVEVPGEICEHFEQNLPTTESPDTTEPIEDNIETVAMIVGGVWELETEDGIELVTLPEVELFGCPDSPDTSKVLQDYPERVYLSGGTYYDDRVISCGGYSCSGAICTILRDCFQWTPENQWEAFVDNMDYRKWGHIMAKAVDLDGDGQTEVPLIIGQNSITQIWDSDNSVWKRYRDLESSDWYTTGCFFQEGDYIYFLRTDIERLDTKQWIVENLGTIPDFLTMPGKCAYQQAGDTPGILLRNGYWLNLDDLTWHQQRFPPYANVAPEPDAVWSFRGKPTVFGSTVCEGDGTCIYTGVEQYDLATNTWRKLGELVQTRIFHDVIEVPVSFCDFEENPLRPTSSAAMIIGGVNPVGEANIYDSTELFGCPGEDNTITGPQLPELLYYTGGTYYSEDGSVENGSVIICGGFACQTDVAEGTCGLSDACYEYNPLKSPDWVQTSSLVYDKWGHLMTTAPDLDAASNREMPLVLGLTLETQLRDIDTGEWKIYRDLPEGNNLWLSFGCLVRYRYKIYHIREEVFELDTLYWEVTNYGPIPEFMTNNGAGPGRCALTEIDNEIGIMLRNGFFYQLSDNSWHQKKFTPYIDAAIGLPSESLHTFRGKPTYFGGPVCDENVSCSYTEILQYQDWAGDWVKLGNMAESRINHEVIEIPAEFCQTSSTTTTTTTAAPMTTTPDRDSIETVAMLIGGIFNRVGGGEITNSVELFGCPDSRADSIRIADFPVSLYLTAGVYYPDGDRVVVCGGNQCSDPENPRACGVSRVCYHYFPDQGEWQQQDNELNNVKWGHIMGLIEDDEQREVPIVLGYQVETEVYNPDTEAWEEYQDLEDPNWTVANCLIQVGTSVWQIRRQIYELDLNTWQMTEYQPLPAQLENSGRCAYQEIDGKPGILVKNGYWFNIEDRVWEQRRFPPFAPFYPTPNAMWSFRDKPTVFGNTVCEDNGDCLYTEVTQYDAGSDRWNTIGQMTQARGFHAFVEVPVSFCDRWMTTTTSTTEKTTTTEEDSGTGGTGPSSETPTPSTDDTTPPPNETTPGNTPDGAATIANSLIAIAILSLINAYLA